MQIEVINLFILYWYIKFWVRQRYNSHFFVLFVIQSAVNAQKQSHWCLWEVSYLYIIKKYIFQHKLLFVEPFPNLSGETADIWMRTWDSLSAVVVYTSSATCMKRGSIYFYVTLNYNSYDLETVKLELK